MKKPAHLRGVAFAADQRRAAEKTWRMAIRGAHDEGASIRQIAAEADVSSARIHQILHGK